MIKPFSFLFWAVLVLGVGFVLLLLNLVDLREARSIQIILAIGPGSFLFFLAQRTFLGKPAVVSVIALYRI